MTEERLALSELLEKAGDTWHLEEVFIRIRGVLHYHL